MYISTDILLYYVISMIIVTGIQIYVVPSLCICCYSMLVTLFIALHKFNYVIAVSFNNCTLSHPCFLCSVQIMSWCMLRANLKVPIDHACMAHAAQQFASGSAWEIKRRALAA